MQADSPLKFATVLVLLLLALVAAVYWPGLFGTFLLDDQANLSKLAKISSPLTWEQVWAFSFSSTAGPSGRPISMLTFALQYQSWPADPQTFKLVNLALHLINGALVYLLVITIGKSIEWQGRIEFFALTVTAVWLLHPIQASSVLYIVQRMTLLSACFVLAGLIAYIHGRRQILLGQTVKGYATATIGITLGTTLAMLAKESGVLLLVYVLVIETTLFSGLSSSRQWHRWKTIFLYIPIVLAIGFLTLHYQWSTLYQARDFTLGERLITEPRVIMDYLRKFLLIPPYNFGIFFDDFPISKNLLSPSTTLPAIATIVGATLAAIQLRKKLPVFSFAVLWFLGGHLLESSALPLEIYFEHRNYLPTLGALIGFAYFAHKFAIGHPLKPKTVYPLATAGVLLVALALSWQQSKLWGNSLQQAAVWSKESPRSQRATEWAGTMFLMAGYPEQANTLYARLSNTFPDKADGPMFQLFLGCFAANAPLPDERAIASRLAHSRESRTVVSVFTEIVRLKENGRCEPVSVGALKNLLAISIGNPAFHSLQPGLLVLRSRTHALDGDFDSTIIDLEQAYKLTGNKEIAFQQFLLARKNNQIERANTFALRARNATTGSQAHDRLIDEQLDRLTKQ